MLRKVVIHNFRSNLFIEEKKIISQTNILLYHRPLQIQLMYMLPGITYYFNGFQKMPLPLLCFLPVWCRSAA